VVKVCVCVLDLTKIFAEVIKQAVRYMEVSPPTRKTDRLARRVLRREPGNVRFGSKADIGTHARKGEHGERRDCASLKFGAFVALALAYARAFGTQIGPPDRFDRQAGRASLHWTISFACGEPLLYGAYSTFARAMVKTKVWFGGMASPAPSAP
jgi:hypothetical protein